MHWDRFASRRKPTGLSHRVNAGRRLAAPALLFFCSILSAPVFAQDPTPQANQGEISSLLVDKQAPRLGIKWSGEIFLDTPLNGEPENADPTLRKAEFIFQKAFSRKWYGKLTVNYNNAGSFEVGDNYLRYSGWTTRIAQVGIFDPPFSLESVSQSTGLTFMERSLPVVALSESKKGGIGMLKRTENSVLNAGVFFVSPKQEDRSQAGQALVFRYVHSPIDFTRLKKLHLGASFSYRINANPDNVEFKSRPEINTTDDYYVDTGTIDAADKVIRLGLESHRQTGRLSWQTELLASQVKRQGKSSVRFWGGYTFVSWFLTNDSRNYDAGTARFLAVTPNKPLGKGGKGAFELALRASYVDLSDKDVIGGRESDISLGLNWYINRNFRLMTNLIKVLNVDRPGSEFDGLDPLIFSLRLQWQIL